MRILLLFLLQFIASCNKQSATLGRAPSVSGTDSMNISTVKTSPTREGRWSVMELTGLDTSSVISASAPWLIFSGNKTRLNVKGQASGLQSGLVTASLGKATGRKTFSINILPGYPEILITQFEASSATVFNIAGRVTNTEFLPAVSDYKIIACLHVDKYYCQDLATLALDGSFVSSGHDFLVNFPSADRVQFILVQQSIAPADENGVYDNFVETNTRYSVWRAMDGIQYINFKNYPLLTTTLHTDPQIAHLKSRLGKYEQTAGLISPASPARFIRSFLDTEQFYLYDQALAAFAFTKEQEQLSAKTILNALKNQWEAHGAQGWWYFSYNHNNTGSIYPAEGDKRIAGAISWVSMAINYYKSEFPADTDYDVMAKSVIEYLRLQTRPITLNGATSTALRFNPVNDSVTAWDETDVTAVEHNLDFHAALESFVQAYPGDAGTASYLTLKASIRAFLSSLWDPAMKRFYPGANFSTGLNNTSEIYLDTQSWGVLALGGAYSEGIVKNCELFFESAGYFNQGSAGHAGFFDSRLSTSAVNERFVWTEGTTGQILAMNVVQSETGNSLRCSGFSAEDLLNSVKAMANNDGGLPYSTQTNNESFNTSSSVAGTAWLYFANQGFNPFRP